MYVKIQIKILHFTTHKINHQPKFNSLATWTAHNIVMVKNDSLVKFNIFLRYWLWFSLDDGDWCYVEGSVQSNKNAIFRYSSITCPMDSGKHYFKTLNWIKYAGW